MSERRAFSVSVFARHQGRVLLVLHRRLRKWLPVGGEVEPGETPLEAAERELREETGLAGRFGATPSGAAVAVEGTPPGLLGYEEHAAGSKGLHLNFAFVADVASDQVVANDEFGAWRWVGPDEPIDAPENVRQLLARALAAGGDVSGTDACVALARAWLAAFNARDLARLVALYHEDAEHYSPKLKVRRPETQGLIRGRAEIETWFADAFARLPHLHYAERRITAMATSSADDAGRVVLEYLRTNPGEPDLDVAETFQVRGGRITASRVYHG